jgi:DNA-binding response OmpR family regulator/REP element-mobilizing transposase RayT
MQSERILVVTSTKGFGQLIQQTLEESGRYLVSLVNNGSDALLTVRQEACVLLILDATIKGESLDVLTRNLRIVKPELKLILIPPDNDVTSPINESIKPDGYLTKPFYLPDLFDTIEEVLGVRKFTGKTESTRPLNSLDGDKRELNTVHPLAWMEDVNLAAQHLTRLSLEPAAHAALIVRENQLWSYAGHLSEQAAEELASIVNNFWLDDSGDTGSSGDKVRFIRLESTGAEYLLYVTALGDGMVLALAFDTETPFSKIRAQAVRLARSLASPPDHISNMAKQDWSKEQQWAQESWEVPSITVPDIRPLIGDMPPPNPNVTFTSQTSIKNDDIGQQILPEIKKSLIDDPYSDLHPNIVGSSRSQSIDTRLRQGTLEPLKADDLRPVSPAMHNLNFACLLIPRIPAHHLTGELASSLSKWMGQLCLAYGWRLEYQSIRPGYLLWVANVSPFTSPSSHIRTIRKQTSARIFKSFPNFMKHNPSGDFWAPGYLIVSSSQPPAADIINEFIYNSRQHQGA